MTVPVSALQEIAPGAVIELFELELNTAQHGTNDTYRFHAGTNLNNDGEVVWNGNSYLRFPVEADGFEYSGNGQLPRPKIRVSNILSTITALLLTLPDGLEGAKFTRIRTLGRYLDAANFPATDTLLTEDGFDLLYEDGSSIYLEAINPTEDPTAEFPREIYYVDRKVVENRDVVEFELAAAFDLAGVSAPKRQCIANICQWEYRSTECGYTGTAYHDADDNFVASSAQDVCGKRLSSCRLRFGELIRTGTLTAGSNVVAVNSSASINPNDSIKGFGIPSGTVITAINGDQLTLSANATVSSSLSKTGTLQANASQIVMTDVNGLAVGMSITGPKLSTGTVISQISGNTITLQQSVDIWQLLAVAYSVSARLDPYTNEKTSNSVYMPIFQATNVSVGDYVTGPGILESVNAQVTTKTFVPQNLFTHTYVVLSYSASKPGIGTYNFFRPVAQSPEVYTFSVPSNSLLIREDAPLNFGSFPGIGSFYS